MLVTCAFAQRYEVVAYQEDFESGENGWTHYDGAESPNNWHVYDFGGAQANVWWMGDSDLASGTEIGGYYNHQYLVLDTPAQTLTAANATLTFKMRLGLEEPGASGDYDGWDSANVRISTDGGSTWNVLTGPTPAYDFVNSYAFGFEHGEGMGIPGWGDVVTTWTPVTFSLASYVGQSVKIRFAFASDPAYSTAQQPNMFGFMVDDIAFGGYSNNGVDDGQMTFSSMVPLGGDFWHLATEATAPSPTHVMKNQNPQGSYNDNMLNYLVSPSITLPSSGNIWCDFQVMGSFSAAGTFPDVDYWGWEISPDNGTLWNAMSNPYANPDLSNYVYSDAPTVWASMIESYSLDGIISEFAGQTVKFRWFFQTNASITEGPGIMIDDFTIWNDVLVAAPENLIATVDGQNVNLQWTEPGGTPPPPVGFSDDFEAYNDFALSFGDWTLVDVDMAPTYSITDVTFPNAGSAMAYIIFNPTTTTPPVSSGEAHSGNKYAASFAATVAPNNDWMITPQITPETGHNFTFWARSYTVQYGMERFKVGVSTTGTAPANFTPISGTSYIEAPAAWTQYSYSLSSYAGQPIYVGIQCVSNDAFIFMVDDVAVQGNTAKLVSQTAPMPVGNMTRALNPINYGPVEGIPSASTQRNVSAYRIYRDGIMIDEIAGTVTTYDDMNVEGGMHSYYTTAMYDANESPTSNTQTVFVMPAMTGETYYDDGTAEEGLNVGSSRQMGVLHNWFTDSVTLKYAKVYVETARPASIIVRAHAVGPDGLPGDNLGQVQYPASSVVQGWNYIPFATELVIPTGTFYLVIMETPNAAGIGVDTNNSGHSYVNMGTADGWTAYETGEIMLRAIVYTGSETEEGVVIAPKLAASNYPNPFNPTTTIAYSVPETGMTSVKVFNLKGQIINTLVNKEVAAGNQSVTWNGKDASGNAVSSGLYFVRVENSGKAVTRKMLLSK